MRILFRNFTSVIRRFKVATLLNVLGLSVAFAVFILIMTQVLYESTYNHCYPNRDRIVRLEVAHEGKDFQAAICRPVGEMIGRDWAHVEAVTTLIAWDQEIVLSLADEQEASKFFSEKIILATPDFAAIFPFTMVEGSDKALEEPNQILIPLSMAQKMFPGQSALGKTLKQNKSSLIIGGIYKDFPRNALTKNVIYAGLDKEENTSNWGSWNYHVYFLLDNAQAAEGANEFLTGMVFNAFDYAAAGFDSKDAYLATAQGRQFRLMPLDELYYTTTTLFDAGEHGSRQTTWLLFAIAIIILVIADINFTNFSTALAPMRMRSINTQKVLGSTNGRLRATLVTESIFISFGSFLLALLLVYVCQSSFLNSLLSADIALSANIPLVLFTAGLAVLSGLLAGLYPAIYMTSFSPALVLKGSFGLSPKGRRLRSTLLCIQYIASISLIIIASFMYLQNRYMKHSDLGYDKDQLYVTFLKSSLKIQPETLTNELCRFSGITDVAFAESPLSAVDDMNSWGTVEEGVSINYRCITVSDNFLKTIGVEIAEGRDMLPSDSLDDFGTYIFNQAAKEQYNLTLGKIINTGEIVGFMPNFRYATFRRSIEPMAIFVPGQNHWARESFKNTVYIRLAEGADRDAAQKHIQATLEKLAPNYPFFVNPLSTLIGFSYTQEDNLATLITVFSLLAILISMVGVFGLVVFENEHKRKEIGIRKTFGSTVGEILRMLNSNYVKLLLLSFIIASPISYVIIKQWLKAYTFRTPLYGWVFAVAFLIVTGITLLTVTFQSWRSANENPIRSLRND